MSSPDYNYSIFKYLKYLVSIVTWPGLVVRMLRMSQSHFHNLMETWLCCSRKYPYPTHEGFLAWTPPPPLRNSILVSYFPSKNRAFETPLPLGISVNLPWGGHGYFLELHILLKLQNTSVQAVKAGLRWVMDRSGFKFKNWIKMSAILMRHSTNLAIKPTQGTGHAVSS